MVVSSAEAAAESPHPVAFWRQIAENKYAVPAGNDLAALTGELTDMLASPDPELRDDIAYSTLTAWIYQTRVIGPDALRTLIDRLVGNLKARIGERDTDGVLRRSFSALILSVVVARDNAAPFLSADEFHRLETAALDYLAAEQDVRGYDATRGWMHSAAHTADLLKFLARGRFLAPADQVRFLDAITRKLSSTPTVFTHGEDERLARAVLSIVNRSDFDRTAFKAWTTRAKPARLPEKPTTAQLSGAQNTKNLLAKLQVLLTADAQPSEAIQFARDSVRVALEGAF
jgi:hypothetical protein